MVYPCAHGVLSTGNEALRAHEATLRDGTLLVGAGKLFLLIDMRDAHLTDDGFEQAPRGYRRDDRGMARIHCQL
ncbi:MAG TPA: hypothetical protein VGQ42_06995 [Candidatus Dormibacteraeota bacterium]|nr:hypothetical protein [Candidatus Dormibacteraeota bacterium]